MKYYLNFIIFTFFTLNFSAQIATGNWRLHVSNKGIAIASNEEIVLAAMENGVIEYDLLNKEISEWTKVNSLSDINVSKIHYDKESASFFIGYQNGNIDKLKDNTITNIPAIKLAGLSGNTSIQNFIRYKEYLYAATGFGIVLINTAKNEVKDTYYPTNTNEEILDIAFQDDTIYALTKSKVLKAASSNLALVDYQQWQQASVFPELNTGFYKNLKIWNNKKYVLIQNDGYGNDSIYEVTENGLINKINFSFGIEINTMETKENIMLVNLKDGSFAFNENFELITAPFSGGYNINASTFVGDIYFGVEENKGLFINENGSIKNLQHKGPPKNNFFSIKNKNDKMAFAGGMMGAATSMQFNTSGIYLFENENWTLLDRYNQNLWKDKDVWDALAVAINPTNTNEVAIGSYCEIPVSIVDGTTITTIYNPDNSLLEETKFNNNYSCVNDLNYDSDGNLWVLNGFSKFPLKMLDKDKVWHEFNCGNSVVDELGGRILIDDNGIKWFYVLNRGLVAFSENETVSDPSDDKYKVLNDGETTGALPSNYVTAIAMDQDNELWIGTDKGFGILNNTSNVLDASPGEYNVNRIKVEFEGNVEYILGNTYITDIEVDGGNRKWLATANSGVILLSENGYEILETYTKENSKLISNNIVDIEFNDFTGELFIITDVGLVSYRTDASLGDDEYKNVKVFPNPVKPNFEGYITIQGIKGNSDVKFTDIAGNLVYQTTSNGGTAVWNGKNLKGEKVAAGTYLIWTASNIEKGKKVGRVVIIN